jgi:biotin operon repressor
MTWAWKQTTVPGPTALLVLIALAEDVREAGVSYLSHAQLAEKCHLSTRAVYDALKALEAEGVALIERSKRSNGLKRLPDRIQLRLSRVVLFENGPEPEVTEYAIRDETKIANRGAQLASPANPTRAKRDA